MISWKKDNTLTKNVDIGILTAETVEITQELQKPSGEYKEGNDEPQIETTGRTD